MGYVLNIFRCIGIIILLFFHEIFYYTIRLFVVALHPLLITPRFTEKCQFHRTSVKYLGFIISTEGCTPDPATIETVVNGGKAEDESLGSKDISKKKKFSNLTSVQRFLVFSNFYRRFIKNYSGLVAPLTKLTEKDIPFVWTTECQSAVDTLKTAFTTAPILRHFDHDREIIVETEASDYVSAGILS